MAFKHFDFDRLSSFRRLYTRGEGELSRIMAPIPVEHLRKVKAHSLSHPIPSRLTALIQLNTCMRISEPVLARLDDFMLDHDIPQKQLGRPQDPSQHLLCAAAGCVGGGGPRTAPPRGQAKKRLANAAIRIRNRQNLVRFHSEKVYAAPGL